VWQAFFMAPQMGGCVGPGAVLLGSLPNAQVK